jgi:hypothetical protein
MTRQLSIVTGCSAGATESFVVVPFELVKIKYVPPVPVVSSPFRRIIVGYKTSPWRVPTTAPLTSCGRSSAGTVSSDYIPVWNRRFGGTWSCHAIEVGGLY